MTISNVNSLKGFALDHHEQGLVSGPSQGDVDLFNSAMRTDHAPQGHLADGLMGVLSERLGSQEHLSQQAMRSMKNASGSSEPMDVVKMSRSLSQYSLQMAMTTKVVNKGAQALDKLTNLQ
ncbi:type III secretion system inner rod subunit SctI [Pseudomonas sp. SDO528_S397]